MKKLILALLLSPMMAQAQESVLDQLEKTSLIVSNWEKTKGPADVFNTIVALNVKTETTQLMGHLKEFSFNEDLKVDTKEIGYGSLIFKEFREDGNLGLKINLAGVRPTVENIGKNPWVQHEFRLHKLKGGMKALFTDGLSHKEEMTDELKIGKQGFVGVTFKEGVLTWTSGMLVGRKGNWIRSIKVVKCKFEKKKLMEVTLQDSNEQFKEGDPDWAFPAVSYNQSHVTLRGLQAFEGKFTVEKWASSSFPLKDLGNVPRK